MQRFLGEMALNCFFSWSGGELSTSDGQIVIYLECCYLFEGFDEDEVVKYLRSQICAEANDLSETEDNCRILFRATGEI